MKYSGGVRGGGGVGGRFFRTKKEFFRYFSDSHKIMQGVNT